jgi:lysophospholipase L1-like esterase
VRVQINDWIRARCPENGSGVPQLAGTPGAVASPFLSGWFETADTVESARNSGKWKATGSASGYTADGVHPSQTGHAAMAAAIDTVAVQSAYNAQPLTSPRRIMTVSIGGTPTAIRLS